MAMRMPKAKVLKRYPLAYAVRVIVDGTTIWLVWPSPHLRADAIGFGKNALGAWREAARTAALTEAKG